MGKSFADLVQEGLNTAAYIERMEQKAPKRKPVHAPVPASKRGTLFAIRNKRLAIREAAIRHSQIIIKYKKTTTGETKKYIVAPYSWRYRKLRVGRRRMLYAWDMRDKHIKSFAIRNIKNVAITDRRYKPRWKIEIF